jgi:sugar phosphate isomerase/epimerase
MKLGFITAPFPDTPLGELADWAAANGFDFLEVCCWPRGDGRARRYAGVCHIDVENLSDARAKETVDDMANRGIEIPALGYYPNPLHPDPEHRQHVVGHLKKVITAASQMGVPVVNTFIGADHTKTQGENWDTARKVWPEIVSHAESSGVKIALENCPMLFSAGDWPSGHNLAHSPSIWRSILEEFDETVGLNFDPSHLVWLMIDIEQAIAEFGERFYFFQAKDTTIDRRALYEHGILSGGIGWQSPRLPGLGDIEWGTVFSALYRVGYDGPISIEHEDRDFEGTDELVKRGLLLARDILRPYVK